MTLYLVTGGAGFIGSHIVEALVERGERVRVLDNFSTGKLDNLRNAARNSVEIIEGDVLDLDTVRQAMDGVSYVLHQAAIVGVHQSMADPLATHSVNVTGTLNVLTAAYEIGVKRVVFASSCAVYGDNDALPLQETAPPRPLSPYAASKLAGEAYCQTFFPAYHLPTVCLRYFNVFGPRQQPNGDYAAVIPKFIERMKAGLPPTIYGDGKQTRDFIHVSDVVRANLLACEHQGAVGQIFNVALGQPVSLLTLVSMLNSLRGTPLSPQFEPVRPGDIRHSAGDSRQIATRLGFKAEMSVLEGLRQLVTSRQ
jgi:UDP-glucose 4-epimerase